MIDLLTVSLVFLFGYVLNMFYISVLYHRGLTHGAVILGPKMLKWLELTGVWVTGMDPKSWAAMHRMHHLHSDGPRDPHSPVIVGVMGVWMAQYHSYLYYRQRMVLQDNDELNQLMKDVKIKVTFGRHSWMSNLPYLLHIIIALALVGGCDSWPIGIAYFLGIASHPVQGWMINGLAHAFGGRNFATNDNSRNNVFLSLFVFGEGLQNNHHAHPQRANFAIKGLEFDPGYILCHIAQAFKLIKIHPAA